MVRGDALSPKGVPPPPHYLTPKGGERHLEEIEGGKEVPFQGTGDAFE
jgi:hypothetical protein